MATTYTRFVWPPLIFPLPVFFGKIGPTQVSPIWPPMRFPIPSFWGNIGPVQVSPTWPKMLTPVAATASVNWTPATQPPNTTTYVRTTLTLVPATGSADLPTNYVAEDTVRKQINSFFGIISNTPGSGK